MSELIRNSMICRIFSACARAIHGWWSQGLLARAIVAARKNYHLSASYRLWLRLSAGPDSIVSSRYYAWMQQLRHGVEKLGSLLSHSLFYRLMRAIKTGYLKLSGTSRLLSLINRLSLRQWLIAAFALYLPISFILREYVGIAIVSALWEEIFMFAALFFILWRRALKQTAAISRETALDAWLLLFMAVGLLLMVLVKPYPDIAFEGYRAVVQYMLWFFLIIRLIEDDRDMRVFLVVFMLMAAFCAVHGLYQYVIGVEIPSSWVSQTEMGVRTRVFSLTGSPNILGSLLVMTAPLVASLIYFSKSKFVKVLALGLTCCFMLSLLFTFSRGAWIGMIVAVVIFAIFVDKRLLVLLAGAVAAVLVLVPSITSRLTYLFTEDYAVASSVGGRALRWELGRALLHENNPWLGFGLGRFGGAVAMNNQVLDQTEEFSYFYMDNYYLKTMVEMGYLGIIAYALLLIAVVVLGLKAIQRSDKSFAGTAVSATCRAEGNYRLIAIAIFSGLCGVLAHCFFENIFEETYMTAYFWGLAAILMYLGFFRKKQESSLSR